MVLTPYLSFSDVAKLADIARNLAIGQLTVCSGWGIIFYTYLKSTLGVDKTSGKRIIVMSTRGRIARELLERAKFIDLRKLKNKISQ